MSLLERAKQWSSPKENHVLLKDLWYAFRACETAVRVLVAIVLTVLGAVLGSIFLGLAVLIEVRTAVELMDKVSKEYRRQRGD